MKKIKQIDFIVQVVLFVGFFIASLINQDFTFLIGYCIIGGWQTLSMLVHFSKNWFNENKIRFYYQRIALLAIIIMVLAFPINFLFFFYFIMIFAAPVMALVHIWICYDEIWNKMKRPLAILK